MAKVGEGLVRLMKDEFGALCTVAVVVKSKRTMESCSNYL